MKRNASVHRLRLASFNLHLLAFIIIIQFKHLATVDASGKKFDPRHYRVKTQVLMICRLCTILA